MQITVEIMFVNSMHCYFLILKLCLMVFLCLEVYFIVIDGVTLKIIYLLLCVPRI